MAATIAGLIVTAIGLVILPEPAFASVVPMSVDVDQYRSCAVGTKVAAGKVVCWGPNSDGEIGDGTHTDRPTPTAADYSGALSGLTITQVATSYYSTCALSSAGRVYCWGDNSRGQLGDGTTTASSTPVAVDVSGALNGVTITQIAGGEQYVCALSSAGRVYCWGDNGYGQLGDGTTTEARSPVAVDTSGALNGVTVASIDANWSTTCALSSTGHAYCWGANGDGQIGDNTTNTQSTPTAVDTSGVLNGVTLTHIAVGDQHTCALSDSGRGYCWGYNYVGQLGDGTTTEAHTPVAVDTSGALNGLTLTHITAGGSFTCAVSSLGRAYCWGNGSSSQLGDGTATSHSLPTAVDTSGVLSGRTITGISAGYSHACVTTDRHGLDCWGWNAYGEAGDPANNHYDSPTVVIADDTAPGQPTSYSATAGNASALLTFSPPVSDGGSPITGYEYSTDTTTWHTLTTTGTGPIQATVTGLVNGVSTNIQVRAVNSVGGGTPSSAATVTPAPSAPSAPTSLTATPANTAAALIFHPPADDGGSPITGYEYSTDTTTWHTLTTTGTDPRHGTVTGLVNGVSVSLQVRAVNAIGSGSPSNTATVTPTSPPPVLSAPSAPAAPTVTAGTSSITVSWPAASGYITGYTAYANPGPATCTTNGALSCVIGAVAGTPYTVTVMATGPGGTSSSSPASTTVTPSAPAAPPTPPANAPLTLTTDKGQLGLATPAQQITVLGNGFAAHSTATVSIYSTPTTLATVTTDGNGDFAAPVTVPADLPAGHHTFLALGVDPQGASRAMALPVTVVASQQGSNGNGNSTQHTTLPIPAGGAITLLDSGGNPANTVTINNQGTYALDATTGVITFVPVAQFTGTATPVTYRVTDALGTAITGTYTATVSSSGNPNPGPPAPNGSIKIRLAARTVTQGQPTAATLPVTATFGAAITGRTTVTLWGIVSGKRVILGAGATTLTTAAPATTVTVVLNALGRAMTARPGGYPVTAAASTTTGTTTLHANATTWLVLNHFTVPRAVYFATASSTISAPQRHYLLQLRAHLTGVRAIVCTGNTDNRGNIAASKALGLRRAKAVCATLAAGLHVKTVTITKGESSPTGNNNTPTGRARNRRADITLYY